MYIGLISDTHGVFSQGFRDFLEPVDQIWHAGDFGGGEVFFSEISSFKPLVGVYGNCDGSYVRYKVPQCEFFRLEGLKILMTHIGGSPGHYESNARALIERFEPDIFVCGHSHILKVMRDKDHSLLYLNPGAAGLQGWQIKRTALRFKIEAGQIKDMEVFELDRAKR